MEFCHVLGQGFPALGAPAGLNEVHGRDINEPYPFLIPRR
jgi:hypothetical protein